MPFTKWAILIKLQSLKSPSTCVMPFDYRRHANIEATPASPTQFLLDTPTPQTHAQHYANDLYSLSP